MVIWQVMISSNLMSELMGHIVRFPAAFEPFSAPRFAGPLAPVPVSFSWVAASNTVRTAHACSHHKVSHARGTFSCNRDTDIGFESGWVEGCVRQADESRWCLRDSHWGIYVTWVWNLSVGSDDSHLGPRTLTAPEDILDNADACSLYIPLPCQ